MEISPAVPESIFAKYKVKFKDIEDFRSQVSEYFSDVPSTFFQGWQRTGLQSGDGPEQIKQAIEMFRDGSTLKTVKSESPLFLPLKAK